eukprot:m.101062 g.101062  ORF g.101062 m.101062 type:complete len:462 (-) comp14085_c1_seq1:34-1419(-)
MFNSQLWFISITSYHMVLDPHEAQPLLAATVKPTALRWWMCFVLSAIAFVQGWVWNTWSPIAPAIQDEFQWSDGTFALLANWGPICYLVAVAPTSWLLDTRGLRLVCLIAAGGVFLGSGLRCFRADDSTLCLVLTHIGQALNGLAGPVAMAAAPVLSATWFPTEQRATATAIMAMANTLGVALAFVVGPALVPSATAPDDVSHRVLVYMWASGAMALATFLCTFFYFPNRPPHAPTVSASSTRVDFLGGMRALASSGQFWIISLSYGIMTGTQTGWGSYLAPNLENFLSSDTAEDTAAWLGFYSSVAGCVGSLVLGRMADLLGGRMKLILIVINIIGTLAFLWFTLICNGTLPASTPGYYASTIIGGLLVASSPPLYYELAVETVYPIAEGLTTGWVTAMNNIACGVFLILPYLPSLGSSWANWAVVAACAFGAISMFFFKENYRRMAVDRTAPALAETLN